MNKKILVTQSSMPSYEEYIEMIRPLWESHWLTNMGELHRKLEEELKTFLEVSELSLVVNGHMALELAIQMYNFPEGSEVITTPFTFISTTHAIVRNGLVPVFCDIKASDGTIDEEKIEGLITDKTVAIVPVHVYGNVCNVERIDEIARKNGLKVIYDAAHAFGVTYKGKGIANFGDTSIFSFHATKVFNTIEGGAVAVKDREYYDRLYNLKNFGIRGEERVVGIGCNAKMNEFAAAMGLCNLKYINKAFEKRKRIYDYYVFRIKKITGIRIFENNRNASRNYAYFPIIVEDDFGVSRDELYDKFKEDNIYTRKYFYPLTSEQECYKNQYTAKVDVAKEISSKVLTLPIYEELKIEEAEYIINRLCEIKDTGTKNA